MEIKFNGNKLVWKAKLTEQDVDDAFKVKQMMQTEGWRILEKHFEVAKESLLDNALDKVEIESFAYRVRDAMLKGMREWLKVPHQIVAQYEQHVKDELEKYTGGLPDDGSNADAGSTTDINQFTAG